LTGSDRILTMTQINNGKQFMGGLAKKFILYILLFSSFITLLGTSYQLYRDYSHDLGLIETSFDHFEKSQRKTMETNLWVSDFEQLKVQLQGILDLPGMQHIEIEHGGKLIMSLGEKPLDRAVTQSYPLKYTFRGRDIELGVLQISADLKRVYKRLVDRVFIILATQGIKTFLVSLFIFFLFYLFIGRHLDSLALAAQKLTLENLGDAITLDRKKSGSSPDELDQVTAALNDMRLKLAEDVTEIRQTREELAWELKVNRMLAGLANDLIAPDQSIETIAEKVYRCARELSGSEHGFVSEIDRRNGDNVAYTLSAMMGEVCRIKGRDRRIHFPRGEDGRYPSLWGHALNTKESFFTNAPSEHPASIALPEGHVPIRCFLAVPVLYQDEPVGLIALANPVSDYGQKQLEAVQRLADLYAISVHRHRMMEDRAVIEDQLRQSQKMEAVGTLAGGIAHDFNNILGAVLGYAEMIRDDCPEGSNMAKDIEQVLKAGLRAKELVKQILAFSRQAEMQKIPMQPAAIVKEAVKLLRASIPTTIAIEQDIDPHAGTILADPNQIHQIVMNLCTNAYHAMEEEGGTLTVSLKRRDAARDGCGSPDGCVELSVEDTGTGIAEEIRKQIFDPYFTTKEVGKGTGMGLAMVHGIVQSYGGSVVCETQAGEGTVFRVTLPVIEQDGVAEGLRQERVLPGRERILLVDDEQILLDMGRTMLERLGYHVTSRLNGVEALNVFQSDPQKFDLVITDQTMPGITGLELSRQILHLRPDIPVILCTGYSSIISEEKARSTGIRGFAMKPLTRKEIAALIRQVFDENK
jgi:signal transduction histidine kinase/ActR/RegA family two-component response regulator